jgi:hypothetical protein
MQRGNARQAMMPGENVLRTESKSPYTVLRHGSAAGVFLPHRQPSAPEGNACRRKCVGEKRTVIGYEITGGGASCTTPPTVSVPGIVGAAAKAGIFFGKDLETNGVVSAITVSQGNGK